MAALVLDGIRETPALSGSGGTGLCQCHRAGGLPVAKGVPFREAHHIVGEAVVEAIRRVNRWKRCRWRICSSLARRSVTTFTRSGVAILPDKRAAKGGVAPQQVATAIAAAKQRLA